MVEFEEFKKIKRIDSYGMNITQKIHGTNAQIHIYEEDGVVHCKAGKRSQYITMNDDNFGFAAHVEKYKEDYIRKLGLGRHFGEWAGPGINSGEGLLEKTFVLFSVDRYDPLDLPPNTTIVPILYKGEMLGLSSIYEIMSDLKEHGSYLVDGFMRPEGIVIEFGGHRYKKVFEAEETKWTKPSGIKTPRTKVDVSHLLQPIRLAKLLSRDEIYKRDYPNTLSLICKNYTDDLISEGQITGTEDDIKILRKALGSQLYQFIKENIKL